VTAALLNCTGRGRLPVILQSEAAECGLACLAMVASYHGRRTDLGKLRREHPGSLKGATLQHLISVGDRMRLNGRALRLELSELAQLRRPAILHWDLNHFVVLQRVTKAGVVIHDPAVGVRRLTFDALSKHFTGVALEVMPSSDFVAKDARERLGLSAFWGDVSAYKGLLLQLLLMSLTLQVLALLSPIYVQLVVDEAVVREDQNLLVLLAGAFLTILVLRTVLGWIRSWISISLGNLLSLQMQGNVLRHLLRLPLSFFVKRHIGDIVSRFGAVGAIQDLLTHGLIEALIDGLLVATTLVVIWIYQPMLTLIVVGLMAAYAALRFLRYRPLRDLSNENLIAASEASSQFMETIRGIATVKQFGLELERMSQWQNRFVGVTNTGIRISRLNLGFGIANQLLFGIGSVVIVYLGARMVMSHTFTVGMLMAFSSYQQQFVGAGASLIDKWIGLKLVDLHLDRLGDIALTKPEEEARIPAPPMDATYGGEVALKNLRFAYSPTDPTIVDGVDLTVAPGEFVAILGPSGCGKSTLLRLMQGLEQPTEGVVSFGGVDIRRLGLGNYRAQVASVTQQDRLLSGSVAENITLFDPKIDQGWMVECAKRCMIHDTIMAMPMNYHSLIGDMGDALSAGERQRLMLARALYRRPSVLFLDEATCHMDPALDVRIMEMIAKLGITRVVVTHRATPVRHARRVLQLVGGKLRTATRIAAAPVSN